LNRKPTLLSRLDNNFVPDTDLSNTCESDYQSNNRMFTSSESGRYDNNKTKSPMNNIQKFPIRYIILGLILLVSGYFGVQYLSLGLHSQTLQLLSKDRSENYHVKVVPASFTDEELNSLPKDFFSYLAMIDAGSSGCRAHVYRYAKLGSIDGPLYVLPQHNSRKVKPGLSTFAQNPQDAGSSLAGLVDFLKEQVPERDWGVTPIWLKATAGLRMLKNEESEAILDSVRGFLSNSQNSPFLFRNSWARVISGTEEGGFGWIAFNYLKRIIGPKRDPQGNQTPYAVIEMGGASAQVSQLAPTAADAAAIPPEYRFSFTIENQEYNLYTHSYLGYGAEQAKVKFLNLLTPPAEASNIVNSTNTVHQTDRNNGNPCVQPGGTARRKNRRRLQNDQKLNSSVTEVVQNAVGLCVRKVADLFTPISPAATATAPATTGHLRQGSSDAGNSQCGTTGPFSFDCVYQPHFVASSSNILAFENFFYMSSALGVKPEHVLPRLAPPSEAINAPPSSSLAVSTSVATTFPLQTTANHILEASNTFCSTSWSEIESNYPKDAQPKDVNQKMCFLSAFAYSFLVDGLKVLPNKIITIQKEVEGNEIEWALGAAYKETAEFLKRTNLRPT